MSGPSADPHGPSGSSAPAPAPSRIRSRALVITVAAVVVVAGAVVGLHFLAPAGGTHAGNGGVIPVVAAENFWGSLVAQLGGEHVHVLSVVSDPNADPHEYESNVSDAVAVAQARLVIENGAGYDDWCAHLVAASSTPGQVVLNVADVLGIAPSSGVNPHFWYGAQYVNRTIAAMYSDLVAVDRSDATYFQQQYAQLNASLAPVWAREAQIRAAFGGTQVASTESIFAYMANSTGLDLVSPYAFMNAVAEGNDPPAASVATFQDQLESGNVSVLVYNQQTATPLTQNMKAIAAAHNVSIVGVTETIQPPDESFEFWMGAELAELYNALNQGALGH